MNQVMVEELSQSWMEPNPQITEAYAEQPLATHEDEEYMSYLSHYVVQGDQHIPVYQTAPINTKARDMNNTNPRPPIQCYKCNGPHKANVMDAQGLIITRTIHTDTTMHCQSQL